MELVLGASGRLHVFRSWDRWANADGGGSGRPASSAPTFLNATTAVHGGTVAAARAGIVGCIGSVDGEHEGMRGRAQGLADELCMPNCFFSF